MASMAAPCYHEESRAAPSSPSPVLWQTWGWACGTSKPSPGMASPCRVSVARLPDEVQQGVG